MPTDYTMGLIGNGFSFTINAIQSRLVEARSSLRDLELEHNSYTYKMEEALQELGLNPSKLSDNSACYNLYCLTSFAKNYLNKISLIDKNAVHNALFTLIKYPGMFVIVELTNSYCTYCSDIKELEKVALSFEQQSMAEVINHFADTHPNTTKTGVSVSAAPIAEEGEDPYVGIKFEQ